ncbi:ribonuclease domain-containing protein [Gordonia neofelifaecis]|uniref:Guanine-specific ribonuclease N1 and T1 n=1 Tax=Gordonia neofelifaecis NRRL B-59395 TaxID=644548 RepID=F1YJT4_9ACTN|nr:ribonuclease domain-containing protein [Gordonia neofelifaecis]EGD55016.1 guanine-specific ribonuclease N1 and T1 [Gordonia neofelifaecis NRRL B-59395]
MSNSTTDPELTRRRVIASALAVVALLAVLAFTWWIDGRDSPDDASSAPTTTASTPLVETNAVAPGEATVAANADQAPTRVTATLAKIDSGRWPEAANAPGTHGGDTFRNNERKLPVKTDAGRRITYKEWDVNPKKPNRGRDAERIVTGSDGSAWYTLDHYRTFVEIRGPSA